MIGDTASISLLTGLPGSGKSLRMLERIVQLVEKGEHVYTCNINGISVPGITPWDDPTKWRDLPAGAVLFVDEAQQYFRARRGGEPPDFISAMETIRHTGVRLVLATQQPNYLDTHLRGLVGFHEHLLRQSGKDKTFIFRNHQVMDEVRQGLKRIKALYDHEIWKLPERYFKFYKSAEIHTVKYRMPALLKKVLWVLPIALVLFGGTFGYLFWRAAKAKPAEVEQVEASPTAAPTLLPSAGNANSDVRKVRTSADYIEAITPSIADVPWSAPAWSGREFRSDPHIYCMSTVDTCRCVTEQGTPLVPVLRDDICRETARWGEPYNPFKAPREDRAEQPQLAKGDEEKIEPELEGGATAAGTVIAGDVTKVATPTFGAMRP